MLFATRMERLSIFTECRGDDMDRIKEDLEELRQAVLKLTVTNTSVRECIVVGMLIDSIEGRIDEMADKEGG